MKEYPVYIGGFHHFTREQLAKAGVFIAHDFFGDDDTTRGGYRNKFDVAFRDTPYMPVYAPIDSGTILETLTQSMVNCFAGIFDVTTNRRLNANVLIELGVCLAINHPAIVIAEGTDPLPDFLESLKPLRYNGRRDLRDQLSQQLDERIAESQRLQHRYCVICRRTDCECRTSVPMDDKTYMLLGAHVDADEVDIDVEEALLHFDLKRLQITADDASNLCAWLRLIKRVRFAFFYSKALGKSHHGDENAATMLQLGLAVGSPTPWRIIVPVDEFPPTDVSAFMAVIRNPNARIFQDRISGAASKLLEEFKPLTVINISVSRPHNSEWQGDEAEFTKDLKVLDFPTLAALYNVPTLPADFVPRQGMVNEIVYQLVSNANPRNGSQMSTVVGISGSGGTGKTFLGASICYDERIRRTFTEGILWLDFQSQRTNGEAIQRFIGDTRSKKSDAIFILDGINELVPKAQLQLLASEIHNLSALVVLDDVQSIEDVEQLMVSNSKSSYLIISRDTSVLQSLATSSFQIDRLSDSEAIELLTYDVTGYEFHLPSLRLLAQRADYLPLALKLMNSQLRELTTQGLTFNDAIQFVLERFLKIGTSVPLNEILEISIQSLSEGVRDLLYQLGIFAKNADIPISSIVALWQLGLPEVEGIIGQLAQRALLILNGNKIRLNSNVQDKLLSELKSTQELHGRLINSWGNPYNLNNDYAWHFYIYHLVSMNSLQEAQHLLRDIKWLQAKLNNSDVNALLNDFAYMPDGSRPQRFEVLINYFYPKLQTKSVSLEKLFEEVSVVFVDGLAWKTTKESLGELFSQVDGMISVSVSRGPDGRSRGYGFVDYKNIVCAQEAIERFHESQLDGRTIRVRFKPSPSEEERTRRRQNRRSNNLSNE